MQTSMEKSFRRCVAAAAFVASAAAALPVTAQAQTAERAPVVRDSAHEAAPKPPLADLMNAARRLGFSADAANATLSYPYGIAVDVSNNIYVTNLFGGVNVYNMKGQMTGSITTGLSHPAAVSVSFNGNIYVANNGGNNVTIYNASYTQVGTIADPTLISPGSMYIDADDTVWVLDMQGTLHTYLADGTTLASTHTGGNTVGPWGPYVTVWGIADGNGAYIEAFENRAQGVNAGPDLSSLLSGSPYAAGEAQDQYAQEYVSDLLHNQIQIWSRNGLDLVGTITTPAPPYGVAVNTNLDRLYVVLTTLNQVYVYSTKAPYKLLGIIK